MIPDDVTQPFQPSATPRPWPPSAAHGMAPRPPRQSRGWLAGILAVVGFIVGCSLASGVAMALFAGSPAPVSPTASGSAALKVMFTDQLLTTAMASAQPSGGVSLTQARAHIQPSGAGGEITISGTLTGTPVGAGSTVTLVAQPYVSQNTLAIKIVRASVGGVALPPATLNALRDQINQQLAKSSHISLGVGQGLVVSGISFADGSMTVSYMPAGA